MPTFHPEYGRFQIESTPGAPFNLTWKDLLSVEKDMKRRCVVFAFR
jgi:glutamate--cysteine ligase catalytic subunit